MGELFVRRMQAPHQDLMKESWNRWRQFGLSCMSVSGVKEIVVAGSVMMTSVLWRFNSVLGAR